MALSPCQRSRSARVGTRRVRPVARRMRSRKSGAPAEWQTRPSPSSSAIVLPRRPWRAGRQPVAIEAALARVVDGKTLRWAAKRAARSANSTRNGVSAGMMKSARGQEKRHGLLGCPAMRAQAMPGERGEIMLGRARPDHGIAVAGHYEVGLAVV